MNANEIAEQLENISWLQGDGKVKPFQHYANFVRQQQTEIEALKMEIHSLTYGKRLAEYLRKAQEK